MTAATIATNVAMIAEATEMIATITTVATVTTEIAIPTATHLRVVTGLDPPFAGETTTAVLGHPRPGEITMIEGLQGTMTDGGVIMMTVVALTHIMIVVGTTTGAGTTAAAMTRTTTTEARGMATADGRVERARLETRAYY
jgi:hypothetical protein